ncbi:MAG: hypothetical protein ABJD68_18860 [Nakamurella sp.]
MPFEVREKVAELPGETGLVRHPAWTGSAVGSAARLSALVELSRWRGEYHEKTGDVRTLVYWVAGPGRADVGCWVRRHPASGGSWEATSVAARRTLAEMTAASVDAVVAAVLAGGR